MPSRRPPSSSAFRRRLAAPAAVLLAFVLPALGLDDRGTGRHSQDASLFSQKEYMSYIDYLASDALEGRGTGQEGIDKAAEYIAGVYKEFGVQPAGDNGTYFQNFTLKLKTRITDETRLALGLDRRKTRKPSRLGKDYTPFPFSGRGSFKGPVVFAGYGLTEEDFDEYAGLDVADKVVLVMRRAPKFREFGFMSSTFRGKARKAASRDAAAMLIVNPPDDEEGDKLFDFDSASGGSPMFGSRPVGIPVMHIRQEVAERMLKSAGLPDLATLQKQIEDTRKPVSAELKGVSAQGAVELEPVDSPVRNIVGMIPGTGPQKDEIIILGGHYDHLGIRNKGADGFDAAKDISNGADDNASGTALVMNMAKVYTHGAPPNRTLVLMAYTGEELGLLGSYHFANNPTIDLSKVVAMLNFDMVGRLKKNKLEVGGMRTGGFEDMVLKLAKPYELNIKDGGGGRGPSDHTSFYNKKIPVLFFFTGTHKQYHQPTDDTPLVNGEGAIRIARYAADIIDAIDARAEPPKFTSDTKRALVFDQGEDEKGDPVASAGQPSGRPGRPGGPGQRGMFGNRPRLGIRPDMDAEEKGIVIAEVMEGGAAGKAGLKEGDCITHIGKTKVDGFEDMFEAMGKVKPGDKVAIKYKRGGKSLSVEIEFPAPPRQLAGDPSAPRPDRGPAGPPAPPIPPVPTAAGTSLDAQIAAAKRAYEAKRNELEQFTVDSQSRRTSGGDLNDRIAKLSSMVTELDVDALGKKSQWEALQEAKPQDLPITAELAALLENDQQLRALQERLDRAEERIVELAALRGTPDNPEVKAATAVRDHLAEKLAGERAQKIIQLHSEQIELARRRFLESTDKLVRLKNQLDMAMGERKDEELLQLHRYRMRDELSGAKTDYDQLLQQKRMLEMAPRLADMVLELKKSLKDRGQDLEVGLTIDLGTAGASPKVTISTARAPAAPAGAHAEAAPARRAPRPAAADPHASAAPAPGTARGRAGPHDDDDHADSGEPTQMPAVRLGIMPTYGEPDEPGEGYEISGVVDGGPAAKAGMKDSDRIYQIGDAKIKDVYGYMEALRKFKPGDEISVTVIRGGKKITLKIRAAMQKAREAA